MQVFLSGGRGPESLDRPPLPSRGHYHKVGSKVEHPRLKLLSQQGPGIAGSEWPNPLGHISSLNIFYDILGISLLLEF